MSRRGGRGYGGGRGRGACFQCGQHGHWSRECPNGNDGFNNTSGYNNRGRGGFGRGRGRGRGRGACFKCGQFGHWSRECQNSQNIGSGYNRSGYNDNDFDDNDDDYQQYNNNINNNNTNDQSPSGSDLKSLLIQLDGASYGQYKQLKLSSGWNFNNNYKLYFDRIQSDPFAPASNIRIRVNNSQYSLIPSSLFNNQIRNIACCDYLTRQFAGICSSNDFDRRETGPWSARKGGDILINKPKQYVLERTSCFINNDCIEIRFDCSLPGRGRRIEGRWCADVLCNNLQFVIQKSLLYNNLNHSEFINHVNCVEDQEYLRNVILPKLDLIAFVADDSILPRKSGISDLPMDVNDGAIPFKYNKSDADDMLRIEGVQLKNNKKLMLSGLGVPRGITLIIGGGFHGKSTLLSALQYGVYNNVPGDGREYVSCISNAVKIRSEDSRYINNVNITPFINGLPSNQSCYKFTTLNASGSTSMSANIIENIECGTNLLLIDEDTCATNFMIRDHNMDILIKDNIISEPITPFISRIRSLYNNLNISSILVIGGVASYFQVADNVILMNNYIPKNCIKSIKKLCKNKLNIKEYKLFGKITKRYLKKNSFSRNMPSISSSKIKIKIDKNQQIIYNNDIIDLSFCSQIVEKGQCMAIARSLEYIKQNILNNNNNNKNDFNISDIINIIQNDLNKDYINIKLDILNRVSFVNYSNTKSNKLVKPRIQEIIAALNRLRTLNIYSNIDDEKKNNDIDNDNNDNNDNGAKMMTSDNIDKIKSSDD